MKTHVLILAVLALCLSAAPGFALVSGPDLNATLLYYQPVPAEPGSLLDVYVQVSNNGGAAEQVKVTFVDNGPFTLEDPERTKTTDRIPTGQSFLVKYKVRVSKDADAGTNFIKLEYSVGDTGNVRTALLPIDVFSSTISMAIDKVTLEPQVFVPGSVGTLSITLRNDAGLKISSGTIKLGLEDVDIIPVQMTNQQRFSDLQAGQRQTIEFALAPSPSLTPGIYKIPVDINFTDQQGNRYTLSEYVGIRVGAEPDVSISIDDVKITSDAETGDVFLRVTNKGLGEVKFVNIQLGASESYELVAGGDERYVGNIDSDDYKTARLQLTAKEDTVTIPVTVTYMDSLNNEYTAQETLTFDVRKGEGGKGSTAIIVLVVIALLIGGYFVLRRRRK